MMIKCSAGKGELELSACLACALNHPPCGYDYVMIKSIMNDSEKESRRCEIHVTDITGCTRKAWYDKMLPTSEAPHECLARWIGTAVHAGSDISDDIVQSEVPLSYKGIVGTADAIYANGKIVDKKTTRFITPSKLPYGSHALQVNIYAWMLRGMGQKTSTLEIQYLDMSGPTKCRACRVPLIKTADGEMQCPSCFKFFPNGHLGAYLVDVPMMTDAEVEDRVMERKLNLEAALSINMAPVREPGFLCAYCNHRNECQPELLDE